MKAESSRIQALMACLGDPSRFRIVRMLSGGDHYVLEIAKNIGLSQSCTTRHLQTLVRERLVARARRGKRVMFRLRLEEPAVAGLVAWVLGRSGRPGGPSHASGGRMEPRPDPSLQARRKSSESPATSKTSDPGTIGKRSNADHPEQLESNAREANEREGVSRHSPDPYAEMEDFLL